MSKNSIQTKTLTWNLCVWRLYLYLMNRSRHQLAQWCKVQNTTAKLWCETFRERNKKHLDNSSFITWSFSQTSLVTSWLAELTFWRIDILLKYFAPAARSDPTVTFNLPRVLAEEQPFMSHTRLNPVQWLLWVSKAVLRSPSVSMLWSDRHLPQWVFATENFCWEKNPKKPKIQSEDLRETIRKPTWQEGMDSSRGFRSFYLQYSFGEQ